MSLGSDPQSVVVLYCTLVHPNTPRNRSGRKRNARRFIYILHSIERDSDRGMFLSKNQTACKKFWPIASVLAEALRLLRDLALHAFTGRFFSVRIVSLTRDVRIKRDGPNGVNRSVYLVCLVYLVSLIQPNTPDRPNRPERPDESSNVWQCCTIGEKRSGPLSGLAGRPNDEVGSGNIDGGIGELMPPRVSSILALSGSSDVGSPQILRGENARPH